LYSFKSSSFGFPNSMASSSSTVFAFIELSSSVCFIDNSVAVIPSWTKNCSVCKLNAGANEEFMSNKKLLTFLHENRTWIDKSVLCGKLIDSSEVWGIAGPAQTFSDFVYQCGVSNDTFDYRLFLAIDVRD
jgi:hypothetical protein